MLVSPMVSPIHVNEVGQFVYFLLGRSLHNNLRSRVEKFMAVTDENEATDFGGATDVGDVKTNYWVPEAHTTLHMDNELLTETLTTVICHTPHIINFNRIFSEMGILKWPITSSISINFHFYWLYI